VASVHIEYLDPASAGGQGAQRLRRFASEVERYPNRRIEGVGVGGNRVNKGLQPLVAVRLGDAGYNTIVQFEHIQRCVAIPRMTHSVKPIILHRKMG